MDKVEEYIEKIIQKTCLQFVDEVLDLPSMEIQESQDCTKTSTLSEAATIDFITATRLADNEYKKNLALTKTRDEGRLFGLKVAKAFLSKRKTQETDPEEKKVYAQKISEIDVDIARLTVIVKKTPKRPLVAKKPGQVAPATPPTGRP
jgi:hypothetical protein